MFDCWRCILCKKPGSDDCSSLRGSDEAKMEESDHQIDVPDVIRLVQDQLEGTATGRGQFEASF